MKRNYKNERRIGALQRLESNMADAKEELNRINKSDKASKKEMLQRHVVLVESMKRMVSEIATLESRIHHT